MTAAAAGLSAAFLAADAAAAGLAAEAAAAGLASVAAKAPVVAKAEFALQRMWRAPQGATVEVVPCFWQGDRCKFDRDLALIEPLVAQIFVAPDATLLMAPRVR